MPSLQPKFSFFKVLLISFALLTLMGNVLAQLPGQTPQGQYVHSTFSDFAKTAANYALYIICSIFQAIVVVAGSIATLAFVYAGIRWMTSGDDPGARKNAKDMMKHSLAAIAFILAANFIISWLTDGGLLGCGVLAGATSCEGIGISLSTANLGDPYGQCTGLACVNTFSDVPEISNMAGWNLGKTCPGTIIAWAELNCAGSGSNPVTGNVPMIKCA